MELAKNVKTQNSQSVQRDTNSNSGIDTHMSSIEWQRSNNKWQLCLELNDTTSKFGTDRHGRRSTCGTDAETFWLPLRISQLLLPHVRVCSNSQHFNIRTHTCHTYHTCHTPQGHEHVLCKWEDIICSPTYLGGSHERLIRSSHSLPLASLNPNQRNNSPPSPPPPSPLSSPHTHPTSQTINARVGGCVSACSLSSPKPSKSQFLFKKNPMFFSQKLTDVYWISGRHNIFHMFHLMLIKNQCFYKDWPFFWMSVKQYFSSLSTILCLHSQPPFTLTTPFTTPLHNTPSLPPPLPFTTLPPLPSPPSSPHNSPPPWPRL